MRHQILFTAILFLVATGIAHAQFQGPGATGQQMTIKEVISNAAKLDRQDVMVRVNGNIIEQINNDTYWFQDKTGKIRVEIDKKRLPSTPFDATTELTIIGEVDYDMLEGTEIEATRVIIATGESRQQQTQQPQQQ